jgi:threonyl-tRNA synthetase
MSICAKPVKLNGWTVLSSHSAGSAQRRRIASIMKTRLESDHIQEDSADLVVLRHSTAHLLAAAVKKLWPRARFGVGPAIADGFYYDIDLPTPLGLDDLARIEQKMHELKAEHLRYEKLEVPLDEAMAQMKAADQPYKVELLQLLKEKGSTAIAEETGDAAALGSEDGPGVTSVFLYRTGEFLDLCRGPHLADTGEVGAFKITNVAGAYWRGKESNPQLQRIYGVAFPTEGELQKHLEFLEEAKKRDHRKLGQELDLFVFSELVGSGLPLFTPKGTLIRRLLEEFVQSLQEPLGYKRVHIPHITRQDLYVKSGHWDKFQDDLFHIRSKSGGEFCLKPMNCPHHIQIYASRKRSYRELPIRFSEVTSVYRDEIAGALQGLTRVRMITQDDAHVFCTPEQVTEEALRIYSIIESFYHAFGMQLHVRLSLWDETRPEKYLGEPALWLRAQEQLRQVLRQTGTDWLEAKGEAAFYGPKIDFIARDALDRGWQLATIQLDFNLPERFDLTFVDSAGHEVRPAMLHRAVLGAVERFMAILIEHYAGAFPVWLAPTQAVVIPISDRHLEYALSVQAELNDTTVPGNLGGIRSELDDSRETMQKKIRNAQLQKIPYMLIVGDRELAEGRLSVRKRNGEKLGTLTMGEFKERVSNEIRLRRDSA